MRFELIIPATLLAAAIGVGLTSWRLTKRDFQRRFERRPPLKPEEVLSEYNAQDVRTLAGLWTKLEAVLGVPAGKLRLTDRFGQELRSNPKFALAHPEAEALQDLQECFPNEQLRVSTVRDYCEHALRLVESAPGGVDLAKRILG